MQNPFRIHAGRFPAIRMPLKMQTGGHIRNLLIVIGKRKTGQILPET